jgi:hypothetical protein
VALAADAPGADDIDGQDVMAKAVSKKDAAVPRKTSQSGYGHKSPTGGSVVPQRRSEPPLGKKPK